MTYHQTRVERERNAAKVGRREGEPRARNQMLDCVLCVSVDIGLERGLLTISPWSHQDAPGAEEQDAAHRPLTQETWVSLNYSTTSRPTTATC